MVWFSPPWENNPDPCFDGPLHSVCYDFGCDAFCEGDMQTEEICWDPPDGLVFDDDGFGDDVVVGEVVNGWRAYGLDALQNRLPDGTVIGFWEEFTCGRPAFQMDNAFGGGWEYIGPDNNLQRFIANWNYPWESRLIGNVGGNNVNALDGEIQVTIQDLGNTTRDPTDQCLSTDMIHRIGKNVSNQIVQFQFPQFCPRIPYRVLDDNGLISLFTQQATDTAPPVIGSLNSCIDSMMQADPCQHLVDWLNECLPIFPNDPGGGTDCTIQFGQVNVGGSQPVINGAVQFLLDACSWNVEQIDPVTNYEIYERSSFLPFPGLFGFYNDIQTLDISMNLGTTLVQYCIRDA